MSDVKLSRVWVYLQSHRDPVQATFLPLAKLEMGMLPTKGDLIDVRDYIFADMQQRFNHLECVLRVDCLVIRYEKDDDGMREIVSICGTPIARPNFL